MQTNYYIKRIDENNIVLKKLKSTMNMMPILKIIFFLMSLVSFIFALNKDVGKEFYFFASLALLIIFFLLQHKDIRCSKKYSYYSNLNEVYRDEVNFLNGNYQEFYNGDLFVDKKHEYSYDLDIFGENSFFQRINRTKTYEGLNFLANKLITITDSKNDVLQKQSSLLELVEKENFRFKFLAICRGFDFNKSNNYAYIDKKSKSFITSKKASLFLYSSILISLTTLLLGILGVIPLAIPSFLLTIQLITPIILFRKMNKNAAEVGRLYKDIARYSELLKLVESEHFRAEENVLLKNTLFEVHNSLVALKKLTLILERFDQRENAYALVLLNAIFLSDMFLLRAYFKWKDMYSGHIQIWINSLAEFEARISLANFIFNKPNYCIPQISENLDLLIEAKNMGHPFIEDKKLVTNDFSIYKSNFIIITGANMAGKSTFLRCAGINYIMAVNGMKVCSSEFNFTLFKLFSNMRNTDDLSSGISYFNAELIRIKQLINFTQNNKHTLMILDEILKGTNSKDKLKGSIMFLKEMKKKSVTGIIATHDLELAKLENEYPNLFHNYCFEINISESIDYAYKIQKGVSKNLNATLLLKEILFQ